MKWAVLAFTLFSSWYGCGLILVPWNVCIFISSNVSFHLMVLVAKDDFVSHLWLGMEISVDVITELLEVPALLTSRCFHNLLWDLRSVVSCQESHVFRSWHLQSRPGGDEPDEPRLRDPWPLLSGSTSQCAVCRLVWFPALQGKASVRKHLLFMTTSI